MPVRPKVQRAAVVGAVVLAIGAVVVLAPRLAGGPSSASAGDWPGQVSRCGRAVGDVLQDAGPGSVSLSYTPGALPSGAAWTATATLSAPEDVATEGWVYGTDVSFVQDGVVVAVQDGPQVPPLADLPEFYAGALLERQSLPTRSSLEIGTIACDEYLDGAEPHGLLPGEYEVWVTQTVGLAGVDGEDTPARVSTSVPLVVTEADAAPVELDPAACGAPVDGLESLADPRSNPAPFAVFAALGGGATTAPSGATANVVATLTSTGTEAFHGTTHLRPMVVAVRDGVVAAAPDGREDVGVDVDLSPGASQRLGSGLVLLDCATTQALAPGVYELWAVLDLVPDAPGGGGDPVRVAGGSTRVSVVVPTAVPVPTP